MLSASAFEVLTEVLISRGRIDIAVFFSDKTYIIELKCNQAVDHAIQQIKNKGYADKYRDGAKRVIPMGINFDTEKRRSQDGRWRRCDFPLLTVQGKNYWITRMTQIF
jgi:hypothetical protein